MKDSIELSRKRIRKVSFILGKISSVKQSSIALQVSLRNECSRIQKFRAARVNSCTANTAVGRLGKVSAGISAQQVLTSLSDFLHLLLYGWSDNKNNLKMRLKGKLDVHGCIVHWMEQVTAPKQGRSHLWWHSCLSGCCFWWGRVVTEKNWKSETALIN